MSSNILDALPVYPDEPPPPPPPPPARPKGFPLHPNFWWALAWCAGMLLLTQLFGPLVILLPFIVYIILSNPGLAPDKLMGDPAMAAAIGAALWFAHFLLILFSLLVLRIVAGRDWRREVAIRRPAWHHLLLVLVLAPAFYVFANGVVYVVTEYLGFPGSKDLPGSIAVVAAVVTALVVTGAAWSLVSLLAGPGWSARLLGPAPSPRAFGLSALLLAAFLGQVVGAYHLYLPWASGLALPEQGGGMEEFMKVIASWPLPLGVLIIGLMPGLSEELWCRAFLGRGLVGKHGYWWGVILTSFLFGLIHVQPLQGTMAACVGVVLHYVYLTTRSLWLPMLLHFLNNSLAVVLTHISSLEKLETGLDELPPLPVLSMLAAGLLLLAAVCHALYESRARLVTPDGAEPWRPPYPGVALPPDGSATFVHAPRPSPRSFLFVVAAMAVFAAAAAVLLGHLP